MKSLFVILGLSLLVLRTQAALPQPDLIAQIHFAGSQRITSDVHFTAFTNEFCSADALALRAQTAGKLSGWLAGWLQTNLSVAVADSPTKLRPLFDDLQTAEWFLEARAAVGGKPEVAIAIKLDPARAQLWQANLKPFFQAATFKSAGGWLIFDSNPALLKLGDGLAQRLSNPPAGWLDLDVNWPRLAQWYPELKELGLPETKFTFTALDNNFHIKGKFLFPENLALNLESWRVPTNTLHEPFTSFTAVRGFSSWLQSQTWAQLYQITPEPNQIFFWSLMGLPFQTYAAMPVPDAMSALSQLYTRLVPAFNTANARGDFLVPIMLQKSDNRVGFTGMPYIAPSLRALTEPTGQYLFWETVPIPPHGNPLPPELSQVLSAKNLVCYHWEITSSRMPQLLELSQFGLMMTSHKQLGPESIALKWVEETCAKLGITGTEITQTGPGGK